MPDDPKTPASDDFDRDRAERLIANLREDKAALKRERDEARSALFTAEKERDEAVSAKSTAEKERDADRRASVLKEFEIDEDDAAEFLPDGLGLDELRRKAERLAKRNAQKGEKGKTGDEPQEGDEPKDEPKDNAGGTEPQGGALPGRPKPDLTPGHGNSAEGADVDLDKLAADIRRR